MPTRAERTVVEFERAGRRGLSRRELRRVAGTKFEQVLKELEADGYLVLPKTSKYDGEPWRWTLLAPLTEPEREQLPEPEPPAPAVVKPPQLALPISTAPADETTDPETRR